MGTRLVPFVEVAKSLAPSNVYNRTWQDTVPETSAVECISAMRGA